MKNAAKKSFLKKKSCNPLKARIYKKEAQNEEKEPR